MISNRANRLVQNPSAIMVGYAKWKENPWSLDNQSGVLNFAIAENHLMEEDILFLLAKKVDLKNEHIHYCNLFGTIELREAFSGFAKKYLNLKLDPENVICQTGVTSLCESLSFCLFDEDDEILVPAPLYPGFYYDFAGRFNCKIKEVQLKDYKHTIEPFKEALSAKTKGILLTHPHNPLGEVLDKNFLTEIVDFAKENNLHLISDEVYTLSRHNLDERFTSTFHIKTDYHNIHYLYGMAKDFTLAGLKCGFFTSKNNEVLNAMKSVSYFHTVPSNTQLIVAKLLSEENLLEFFEKSINKIKLNLDLIKNKITKLKFIEPKAGIFFLADLREQLSQNTFEAEEELFHKMIDEVGIIMIPGKELGLSEPGFFRICYAKKEDELNEFIHRMKKFLRTP